ncbi:MAG: hypothetical protein O7C03_00580, partial [Gammaproteobacteria bacterium]|nr:hypothetical protein [Gammaproteobacteria bacterium]
MWNSKTVAEQPRSLRSGGTKSWDEEALKKGNHPGLRDFPWLPDVFEKEMQNTIGEIMTSEQSKCPVMGTAHQAVGGTANQHWWPNQL